MATARDDGGFWAAMFDTVTASDMLQILTPDTISSLSRLAKRSLPVELRGDCLYIYYDQSLSIGKQRSRVAA